MAQIIPFAATAEQAWDAYLALVHEARANPLLLFDAGHQERRSAAHHLFTALYRRECECGDLAKVRRA